MKINKSAFMGAVMGFIYSGIPAFFALTGSSSGDPGPYFMFMLPPFWPVMGTFLLTSLILSLSLLIKIPISQDILFNVIGNIINIIFWIIIGGGIGLIIKNKGLNKWVAIFAIEFGLTLLYFFK